MGTQVKMAAGVRDSFSKKVKRAPKYVSGKICITYWVVRWVILLGLAVVSSFRPIIFKSVIRAKTPVV